MEDICAPKKYDDKNKTCFDLEQLIEITKAYNRYITRIKLNPEKEINTTLIPLKNDKSYLLKELKKRFEDVCENDEVCMTKQAFMNEIIKEMKYDIENNTFRIYGPNDSKEWLSTTDIDGIMKQYENIYSFIFLGAVPLDCNEYSFCSLYKINFEKYEKKGIEKIGIIFNLDRYGQPGSHWVALLAEIKNGEIYYCDSTGRKPIDNIYEIIEEFNKYCKKNKKQMLYKYNDIPYQKDGSECGVYSCNFLIRKLSGEDFHDIINNPLKFQDINSCRNKYFRNKPSKYNPHKKCDP